MLHLARTLASRHSHLTITLLNSPHHHLRILSKLLLPLPPHPHGSESIPPSPVNVDHPTRWYDDAVPLDPNVRLMSVNDGLPLDFYSPAFIRNRPAKEWRQQLYGSCLSMAGHIRQMLLIQQSSGNDDPSTVSFVVVGFFCDWAIHMAMELGIPSVLFWTQSVAVLSIYLHLPDLKAHGVFSEETRFDGGAGEEEEAVVTYIAGVPPLRLRDLPQYLHINDASSPWMSSMQMQIDKMRDHCSAILLNSFETLEEDAIRAVQHKLEEMERATGDVVPAVYTIGPVVGDSRLSGKGDGRGENEDAEKCLEWLEGRAEGSVVYVSFGTLSEPSPELMEMVEEGIRMSGMAYLWGGGRRGGSVLPPPAAEGLAVEWVPQQRVLAHPSMGAFLTHCGWNSTLEAMSEGVPLVALALESDQTTNAKFVADIWKVGVCVGQGGPISSQAVAAALRQVAERGHRRRCVEWKMAAASVLQVQRYLHMDAFLRRFRFSAGDHHDYD